MAEKVAYSIPEDFDWEDETNNLLLNMSGGLLPKDLSEDEVKLLRDRFGPDWFTKLGYSEPEYERPKPPTTCQVGLAIESCGGTSQRNLRGSIMLNRLEEAIAFAVWAHRGQLDKVGVPYIFHPLHVMTQMDTESERIVAVLHDVLEDCPQVELSDLVDRIKLTEEESKALVALTHLKNEPYKDYIRRIINAGQIAINVKWEDVQHNSSIQRMKNLPDDVRERMEKKYKIATEMLWMVK